MKDSVYENIVSEINKSASFKKAEVLSRFFKTGAGEYGEGDKFIGITVPVLRQIAKSFVEASFADVQKLLNSEIHEHRSIGLFILTYKLERKAKKETSKKEAGKNKSEKNIDLKKIESRNLKEVYDFYMKNLSRINNWDLVDLSCYRVVGRYCFENKKDSVLIRLAKSKKLWEKRIGMVSVYYYIKHGRPEFVYDLVNILMNDKHDLMHKACGWMLREAGKVNEKELELYVAQNAPRMPRTMLRYAIERMSENKRQYMLKLKN